MSGPVERERPASPARPVPVNPPVLPDIAGSLASHRTTLITLAAIGATVFLTVVIPYLGYQLNYEPHRWFKLLAGGAAFALIVLRPNWVPFLLCFTFAFEDWLPKSPIPFLNTTNVLVIGGILGIFLLTIQRKLDPPVPAALNLPMLMFLGWTIFGFVNGAFFWAERSREFTALGRAKAFWASFDGFLVFFVTTHLVPPRHRWRLIAALLAGCVVGVLGPLRQALSSGWGERTGGGIGEINRMGAFLAMVSVFAFSMVPAYRALRKAAVAVASAITALAMFLPNSRGAYAGFLVSILPQAIRTSISGTVLLAVILGSGVFIAPSFVKDRITKTWAAGTETEDRSEALDTTSGMRITVWKDVLVVIARNPVMGVGYGNLKDATHLTKGLYMHVHNLYLEVAGEMGLPGLLLLLWILLVCWRTASRLIPRGGRTAALGRAYQGVILCLLVTNLFGQRLLDFGLSGFFFMLSGLVALEERMTRPEPSGRTA